MSINNGVRIGWDFNPELAKAISSGELPPETIKFNTSKNPKPTDSIFNQDTKPKKEEESTPVQKATADSVAAKKEELAKKLTTPQKPDILVSGIMPAPPAPPKPEITAPPASTEPKDSSIPNYIAMGSFDEKAYLEKYKDVADAVKKGGLSSGYEHYIKYGAKEGRDAPQIQNTSLATPVTATTENTPTVLETKETEVPENKDNSLAAQLREVLLNVIINRLKTDQIAKTFWEKVESGKVENKDIDEANELLKATAVEDGLPTDDINSDNNQKNIGLVERLLQGSKKNEVENDIGAIKTEGITDDYINDAPVISNLNKTGEAVPSAELPTEKDNKFGYINTADIMDFSSGSAKINLDVINGMAGNSVGEDFVKKESEESVNRVLFDYQIPTLESLGLDIND